MKEKSKSPKAHPILFQKAMDLFECTQCGTCCQGEGGIYLSREEIRRISLFLNLSQQNFLNKFCLQKNGKVYIHTREDGYCHFSQKGRCSIHEVKPAPCRQWPFFPPMLTDQINWETARNSCPGLTPFPTLEEYLNKKVRTRNSE
jgi:Fe-S-cluster containining protein